MSSRRQRKQRAKKSKKKQSRWIPFLGWGFLALLLLTCLSLFLGYHWIRSYLKSDDFRIMLGQKASTHLNADAQFTKFHWENWLATTDTFKATGQGPITSLTAEGIDANVDIEAIWHRTYRLQDIRVRNLNFTADLQNTLLKNTPALPTPETTSTPSSFWDRLLPNQYHITGLRLANIGGNILTDTGTWNLADTTANITPASGKNSYNLNLQDGDITTPINLLPKATLINATARYTSTHLYLTSARLEALERAALNLEGDIHLPTHTYTLRGKLRGATCQEIIAEDWRQKLIGEFISDFKITGEKEKTPSITGKIKIDQGTLTALPILNKIAAYTGVLRFRRLALSHAQVEFTKTGNTLELRNLLLTSEGLLRITGNMTLEGERILTSHFKIGVTPGTLAQIPGAETKVFHPGENGLLWTHLRLSGSIKNPQEDLSKRLIQAAGERMFELIPETGEIALKFTTQAIDDTTKKLLIDYGIPEKIGDNILQTGSDLIQGGTDLLKNNLPQNTPDNLGEGLKNTLDTGTDLLKTGAGSLLDTLDGLGTDPEKKE